MGNEVKMANFVGDIEVVLVALPLQLHVSHTSWHSQRCHCEGYKELGELAFL